MPSTTPTVIEVIARSRPVRRRLRSRLARDLCYLGRFDEAERLLEEARAVPSPGSGVRVMAASAEALLLAERGELEQAEALARTAVATAETRTDNVWFQAQTLEDLATVLERAGRTDEARRGARAMRSQSGSGSGACPARPASANRSPRSRRQQADETRGPRATWTPRVGREGIEPSTLGLRVPCSTS